MSKMLDIEEMAYCAGLAGLDIDAEIGELESAATRIAQKLAAHHVIKHGAATLDIGGIMAAFRPAFEGQPCPTEIDEADEEGDWE